jgi:putative glutamine amidotransferase
MRPLIGITSYLDSARWGGRAPCEAAVLPYSYVRAVRAVGARAVVLPPDPDGADGVVAALDGLVLAGGGDLDPRLYGAEPEPASTGINSERDAGEIALLRAAIAADLPVLGICRGMQLMVATAGGRLHQHLPDIVGHHRHRPQPDVIGRHPVRTVPGSRLAAVIGAGADVPSHHHQGVADPGSLTVSGVADDDTIEAVERPNARFAVAVLWHPELEPNDRRLFEALVRAVSPKRETGSWITPSWG